MVFKLPTFQRGQKKKTPQAPRSPTRNKSITRHYSNGSTIPTNMESFTSSLLGIELSFETLYTLEKRLRSGSFATVWTGRHILTGDEFAVKVINRKKLSEKDDAGVYREVEIMRALCPHDGIINIVEFFVTPTTFHVILELARGGDVFDRIARIHQYTEKEARDLTRQLLRSVKYVHGRNVCHRDIKPENLLLVSKDGNAALKLADFGFARQCPNIYDRGCLKTRCGTPAFVAPEVVVGTPYNGKADMWAVGCTIYFLLGGYTPFQAEDHRALFRKVRAGDYVFHEKYWDHISVDAKQLISGLLTVDQEARLTADQALRSTWMLHTDERLSQNDLSRSLSEIKKFHAKRKLRGAVHALTWAMKANFWDVNAYLTYHPEENTHETNENMTTIPKAKTPVAKKPFNEVYTLESKIRSGSFATVWLGVQLSTQMKVAVKVISRAKMKPKDDAAVLNEVAILQSLKYKYIIALVDFFEEKDYFYIVLELMTGGDVFDRIIQKKHYTEKDARDLTRILLKAIQFMHSHGVAHRDLKPQNLLLKSKDDDYSIKLADFGFAKRTHAPQSLTTRCGTPTYVAPEILKNVPHDESVDMWSIGVIIYVLLVGYPPFLEDNQRVLFRKIRTGEYEFQKGDWEDLSPEAMVLVKNLLVTDPSKRLTAEQALRSDWICQNDDVLRSRDLSGSLSELKKSYSNSLSGVGNVGHYIVRTTNDYVEQGTETFLTT